MGRDGRGRHELRLKLPCLIANFNQLYFHRAGVVFFVHRGTEIFLFF